MAVLLDRVAAVVGDDPILFSELQGLKKSLAETPALATAYRLDPAKDFSNEGLILERMIEERVIKKVVKELDIVVADAEVETQVGAIAKQNNISRKQLEESIRSEGISFEAYKSNIKSQLERRNLFDRELRKGGGVTESEIRSLYEKTAEVEVKLLTLSMKKSGEHQKTLEQLVKDLNDGKVKVEEASSKFPSDTVDWIAADTLDSKFAKAVAATNVGQAVGPFEVEGSYQVFVVQGNRRGSEEGFQKAKNELSQQVQAQDFERRFGFWLERKKKDMHIVINK